MTDALARWTALHGKRSGFLRRCERYASMTSPKVCTPDTVNQNTESLQNDWTSFGAQCLNHLANKLMFAMFSPTRPFFRTDPSRELSQELLAQGIQPERLREALVQGEQDAIKVLDQRAVRPKLYQVVRHLIVTGNVLLDLSSDMPRVFSLKHYVVKRSCSGRVQEFLIHERIMFDELEPDAQAASPASLRRPGNDNEVSHIRWFKRDGDRWTMTQWVNDHRLPSDFDGRWSAAKFPYHVLTWDLADEHDYGTGLVEDYNSDFSALQVFSEAEVKSAVMASEFRWMADPAGITDVNDFKASNNGDVLPGRKDDLSLVSLGGGTSLSQITTTADRVIQRLGRAFLLGSGAVRDAERVDIVALYKLH